MTPVACCRCDRGRERRRWRWRRDVRCRPRPRGTASVRSRGITPAVHHRLGIRSCHHLRCAARPAPPRDREALGGARLPTGARARQSPRLAQRGDIRGRARARGRGAARAGGAPARHLAAHIAVRDQPHCGIVAAPRWRRDAPATRDGPARGARYCRARGTAALPGVDLGGTGARDDHAHRRPRPRCARQPLAFRGR